VKITNIQSQVKRKDRVSVSVDGKYSFSLGLNQVQNTGLKIGQAITKEELESFKQQSSDGKLLDKVLRWLAIRPRSAWELTDYLKRNKIEEADAQNVTEKVIGFGYIDDEKFAESWVRSRRILKSVSVKRLRQELFQKRVEADIIDKILAEDDADELDVLADLIGRKSKQTRYHDREKLIAYLARQGFGYSDIKEALDRSSE